jgi:four helix bundle protein
MERKERSHKKLDVWKQSIKLIKMIYILCPDLPSDEKFGMISQLKRASVSISLNIAEGAARQSEKEYSHFLSIASGPLSEIDTLIEVLSELELIGVHTRNEVFDQIDKVSALLNGLQKYVRRRMNL